MDLKIASHAGFCFGVRRAVETTQALLRSGETVYTLGPIIHNPQVVASLEAEGARVASSPQDVPSGATAVIRAHGVGRETVEILNGRGVHVVDAACPFVKRIHELADQAAVSGKDVLVIGDGAHPEVQGILGWAQGRGRAIGSEEDVKALKLDRPALVVAQTTIPQSLFDGLCALLQQKGQPLEIRNTICRATAIRQEEAARIAAAVDVMLVIGGKNSSNTRKLYELCRRLCPRTYLAETVRDLENIPLSAADHIGITAGASTSVGTFKEVVARMSDIKNQEQAELQETMTDSDFMADVEKTMVQLHPGQTVTGKVLQITDDEVCVNVGYKSDGLVKKCDLSTPDVKVGDEIEVEVVKVNDGDGNVLLSQRNIVNRKVWDAIVAAYDAGEIVKGVGKESVKGGLIADVMGIRAFIPASLLSLRYVEKIDEFVGQEMDLKIIEIDKSKKRVVASRKAVLQEEEEKKKAEAWDKLVEGEVVKGVVRRLTNFGAFVDIGGVDGLVHVSDLAWKRVGHPSEVVSVGQEIDVKIIKLDKERDRISLSLKATQPKLWDIAGEKYVPGSVVTGKVVRIVPYGAFVELEPGLDGMVHISQCAPTRIEKVEDAVKVGDEIRVKILSVDTENKRISLSIREALADDALENVEGDEFAIPEA